MFINWGLATLAGSQSYKAHHTEKPHEVPEMFQRVRCPCDTHCFTFRKSPQKEKHKQLCCRTVLVFRDFVEFCLCISFFPNSRAQKQQSCPPPHPGGLPKSCVCPWLQMCYPLTSASDRGFSGSEQQEITGTLAKRPSFVLQGIPYIHQL